MMRVAYVCADPGVPVFGTKGASVHVQEVLRGFVRAGADVTLFTTRQDGIPPNDLAAVRIVPLPGVPKGTAAERATAGMRARAATHAALDIAGPFDLVYERYSLWSDAGMVWAQHHGCTGLLEVNAPLIDEQRRHRELVFEDQALAIASSAFAAASALIAVSPGVAAYLERDPQAHGRVHVVANGVDPQRFESAADTRNLASGGGSPVVGFLGTLKPWHGLATLVEAFVQLRKTMGVDARLLLVGDGPERAAITESLAHEGVLDAVQFAGAVPPALVPGWLARMDVAVAPYPDLADFYFSPLKIYEYMAASLPVITSRVGHLSSIVADGEDGILVRPEDPAALADALAALLADPQRCRRMGRAGRERVLRDHSWDAVVARLLAIARAAPRSAPSSAGVGATVTGSRAEAAVVSDVAAR